VPRPELNAAVISLRSPMRPTGHYSCSMSSSLTPYPARKLWCACSIRRRKRGSFSRRYPALAGAPRSPVDFLCFSSWQSCFRLEQITCCKRFYVGEKDSGLLEIFRGDFVLFMYQGFASSDQTLPLHPKLQPGRNRASDTPPPSPQPLKLAATLKCQSLKRGAKPKS
jgi:hypothetical protein